MKQTAKTIWISMILIGFSINLRASDNLKADSIRIAQIVNGFYDWYLTSIKERKYSDFKPKFVESKNGMTTLDYSIYVDNLKKYGFSDSMILIEKQSYSDCIESLRNVKYADFRKTIFTDLDDYEQTNCDFGNYYRWTGGQEPIDGIRIVNIRFLSTDKAYVSIDYYETNAKENNRYYWGKNRLTLKLINKNWKIDQVDSWKD